MFVHVIFLDIHLQIARFTLLRLSRAFTFYFFIRITHLLNAR